jgi:tetratricopeptide (TPR) repeat protein
MSDPAPKCKCTIIKNIVLLLILCLASALVWHNLNERSLRLKENRALELMNEGQNKAAIQKFLEVKQERPKAEDQARLNAYLADCYVNLAEDPGIPFEESLKYYRKVQEFDPGKVPALIRERLKQ